ncbi:hypothetical protein MPSEU_000334300 [Mayamaea pseudoterrestris]|nr:hypothetical protein MPSEU_000334300 [Mayamaea pseudoterrestris]
MATVFATLKEYSDRLTGTTGSLGYLVIIALVVGGYLYTSASFMSSQENNRVVLSTDKNENDENKEPLRNFTTTQLQKFDGNNDHPVYMSVSGIVFDVSKGRDFYGPGGPYEKFAGCECGVALAKMSFDEEHLNDFNGIAQLNFGEKAELEGWIDKFTNYRNYPVKGRLVPDSLLPPADHVWTANELKLHDGTQEIPTNYAAAPIYIGAGTKVFDVSFGGVSFYGAGGPYQKFAGKIVSRALAKMSLDDDDLVSNDVSDLTEKQLGIMNDWIKTFEEKKNYPIVGRLEK